MTSINRDDKIQFIKDGLSKKSLDDILLTFEMYPSRDVQSVLHDLWPLFQEEHKHYSLINLSQKDSAFQFITKLDRKPILDP